MIFSLFFSDPSLPKEITVDIFFYQELSRVSSIALFESILKLCHRTEARLTRIL